LECPFCPSSLASLNAKRIERIKSFSFTPSCSHSRLNAKRIERRIYNMLEVKRDFSLNAKRIERSYSNGGRGQSEARVSMQRGLKGRTFRYMLHHLHHVSMQRGLKVILFPLVIRW
jgi:hypothetical protein